MDTTLSLWRKNFMGKRFVYVSTNVPGKGEIDSISKAFNRLDYIPYINLNSRSISNITKDQIKVCDCVIFIIGNINKGDNLDFMMEEYDLAIKHKKEIIVYLKDDFVGDNDFIHLLVAKYSVIRWVNHDDLSKKLYTELIYFMENRKDNNTVSKRGKSIIITIMILLFLFLAVSLILSILDIYPFNNMNTNLLVFIGVIILFIGLVYNILFNKKSVPSSEYRNYLKNKLQDVQDMNLEADITYRSGRRVDNSNIEGNKDIIALMLKNYDESTEYFSISKEQARASFTFSIITCSIGIIILASSVYLAFFVKETAPSIITLISGVVTEFIAATAFWVHNKSELQLNRYYDTLQQNEKFLSTINLVDKVSEGKRDTIYIEIIKKQLGIDFKINNIIES
jgi:hypothetical protein